MRLTGVRGLQRIVVFQKNEDIGGGAERAIAVFETLVGEGGAPFDGTTLAFLPQDVDRHDICWAAGMMEGIHPDIAEMILNARDHRGVLLAAHPSLNIECYCSALPPHTRASIIKSFDAPARRNWLHEQVQKLGHILYREKNREVALSR